MQALVIIEAFGKVGTWKKALNDIGLKADVVATHGHINSFQKALWPLGLNFSGDTVCDVGRTMDKGKSERLIGAIRALPQDAPIFIATDDDTEGDVISLDLIEFLMHQDKSLLGRLHRARPRALNRDAIASSLELAQPVREIASSLIARSIPGRARAVSDRWIGAVYSRQINHPVGRVRSAVLGAFFLLHRAPHLLRGQPELGEVTLRCRSGSGGVPFVAHIPITGREHESERAGLLALARKFSGKMVPGVVRSRMSLSAAVAPRIGSVRPFNTGDALAYAARHFNLSASQAMTGLQDGYSAGLLSYPRTDSRDISRESSVRVVRIAEACRITGLDVNILHGVQGPSLAEKDRTETSAHQPHEALHPACDLSRDSISEFETILRGPIPFRDRSSLPREDIRDIMVALVARRAIEAARDMELEVGDWRPDNSISATPEEIEILSNLEWVRETGNALPWSKDLMTGSRKWPVRAVAIDMMMSEGIGRPSTYAHHADVAETSGEIEDFDIGELPRPSPFGQKVLAKMPKGLWNPATCRMIETILINNGNICREEISSTLQARIVTRVKTWLSHLPDEMREDLLRAVEDGSGARETALSGPTHFSHDVSGETHDSGTDPYAIPDMSAAPTPFMA